MIYDTTYFIDNIEIEKQYYYKKSIKLGGCSK